MDIVTPVWMWKKEDVLVVGLTEVGGADAQNQLDLFKDGASWNWDQPKKRISYQSYYKYQEFDVRCATHTQKINDLFYKM